MAIIRNFFVAVFLVDLIAKACQARNNARLKSQIVQLFDWDELFGMYDEEELILATPRKGEVWLVDMGYTAKQRPALVVIRPETIPRDANSLPEPSGSVQRTS